MVQIPITESGAAPRSTASGQVSQSPQLAADVIEELTEIECPITHELISVRDADGLIDLYERTKSLGDTLYAVQMRARVALAELCEGDAKTRRVRGRRRQAKVEMPDDSWDNSMLLEAFNSYPQHRDTCLKIASIRVAMREYKKLVGTTGAPDFNQFRDMVTQANRGPSGTPSIKIET